MIKENLEKNIITLLSISFIPLFMEFIIIIILSLAIGERMNEFLNIICIFIAMGISAIILPYVVLKRVYGVSLSDIGIKFKLSKKLIILNIIILSMNLIVFKKLDFNNAILLILHNVVIAISEEFLSRGCITNVLMRIFKSDIMVMCVNILIFVFLFHSGATFLENLIYRLPISIVLIVVYMKSKNLTTPITIHLTYNVLGAII